MERERGEKKRRWTRRSERQRSERDIGAEETEEQKR